MAGTAERKRRPRGAGSIQWRRGRPYAVYRDALTGRQTWSGFDTEEQADAFLTRWAADRKAARVAEKPSRAQQEARARHRCASNVSNAWTFGELLTDWEDRHRDGVQESTKRDAAGVTAAATSAAAPDPSTPAGPPADVGGRRGSDVYRRRAGRTAPRRRCASTARARGGRPSPWSRRGAPGSGRRCGGHGPPVDTVARAG